MTKAAEPDAPLFSQAFQEVAADIEDLASEGDAKRWAVLERLQHPDRVIRFAVRWIDDDGAVRTNTAWRVQHNNALGPYKGGLRFDPSVNEDALRFLAFEQTFKNALTGLPLGGGKGGADFNPKTASATEVMRFCHAFMDEYAKHGGPDADVPAGDIGVGPREIGYLFGRRLKLTGQHVGALTGKPPLLGGIAGRDEATGYGAVAFAKLALENAEDDIDGKRLAISGAGAVALHAARRATKLGARVVTLSDRHGALFAKDGLSEDDIDAVADLKSNGGSLKDAGLKSATYKKDASPWSAKCDIAMPSATQNELDEDDAKTLAENGVALVVEGANMPCTDAAAEVFKKAGVARAPGKAANAGGVAASGLEMSQNASRLPWTRDQTIRKLEEIMQRIHDDCLAHGKQKKGPVNYPRGANRAAFNTLAAAITAMGVN